NARPMMTGGIAMVGSATVEFIVAMLQGGDQGVASSLGILAVMGVGIIGLGAVRVPGWARLRQRQMEEIAARIAAVANARPPLDRRLGGPKASVSLGRRAWPRQGRRRCHAVAATGVCRAA